MITAEMHPNPWTEKAARLIDQLLERLKSVVQSGDRWYEGGAIREYAVPVDGRRKLCGRSTQINPTATPLGYHHELVLVVSSPTGGMSPVTAYIRSSQGLSGDLCLDGFQYGPGPIPAELVERMVERVRRYYGDAA